MLRSENLRDDENRGSPSPEPGRWANTTEQEFLNAVKDVGNLLAEKLSFGPHAPEDIRQLVCVYSLEALPRYRPEHGTLGGFLFRHCSNRLLNFRRNETGWRTDAPCRTCHLAALGCGAGHEDGAVCESFARWWSRCKAKHAVHQFVCFDHTPGGHEPGRESEAEAVAMLHELQELIDQRLPLGLRADYLRLRDGDSVPAQRRRAVQYAVATILRDAGLHQELPRELV